ncbi:MFS transporter [Winslowiella iniecta]|uniref:MFS transporter n=1 Tax=Winslowiella iniecta TaxID=1560201 RepID=UPI00069FD697|nr:MFS transporter [Winslowiella iniecta]
MEKSATPTLATRAPWVALLVAVTFFMENLDATVIATALPQMARDFSVTAIELNVGISAYLLAVALFIPLSGWLADRLGARRVFSGAIILFTLASVMCGFSQSLDFFTVSRVLQGIGGALMVPVGRLVVLRITEKQHLVRMIAFITWPGLIAPVLGPPLGGLMVSYGHWQWIFWLNIPLGIAALLATFWLIPRGGGSDRRPFDLRGFLFTALACAALISGLECLGRGEFPQGAALLVAGLICGWLAFRHSRQHPTPMLSTRSFAIASFQSTLVGGSLFRAAINAIPFLLPLLFQVSFGLSAASAGMLVLWVFAGNLAMKPFTTAVMKRWGFRQVLIVNGLLSIAAIVVCALLTPALAWPWLALILFIGGMSRSMQFTCYNSLGFADIPKAQMSEASTLFSMFFQLSMSIGIAFAALALRTSMSLHGHQQPENSDFAWAFVAVAGLALLAWLDALRLKPGVGEQVLQK